MKRVAWTEVQDFYLRPGFLRLSLYPQRRATTWRMQAIIQRLRSPLFDLAATTRSLDEHRALMPERNPERSTPVEKAEDHSLKRSFSMEIAHPSSSR